MARLPLVAVGLKKKKIICGRCQAYGRGRRTWDGFDGLGEQDAACDWRCSMLAHWKWQRDDDTAEMSVKGPDSHGDGLDVTVSLLEYEAASRCELPTQQAWGYFLSSHVTPRLIHHVRRRNYRGRAVLRRGALPGNGTVLLRQRQRHLTSRPHATELS